MKLGSQTLSRIKAVVPHYDRIMYVFSFGMKGIETKDNGCSFNTKSSVKSRSIVQCSPRDSKPVS